MRVITRKRVKIAAIIFLSLTIVSGLVFLYYYRHYSRMIEVKLAAPLKQGNAPSEIYAAPLVLSQGRKMSYAALVEHLKRAGYKETADKKYAPDTPAFRPIKSNLLEIYNAGDLSRPERYQVKLSGNAIQEIKN